MNFIGIQQSHVISTKGYRAQGLRTGYEQILAHRVDDTFAYSAKQGGKVIAVTEDAIQVEYEDGTVVAIQIGQRFGVSNGTVFPHDLTTVFKVGDTFAKGDILAYNSGFFEPNLFNPKQVVWKAGVNARVALMEASYTLEDSSAIGAWLSDALSTKVTKVKTIVARFDQSIRNLVKVGEQVDLETILCTIEDAVTADSDLFDADSLDTLRLLSSATPKAHVVGRVDKIEVFYHGDPDDMSDSLQRIVQDGDRQRRKLAKQLNKPAVTGLVDQSLRIEGNGLEVDHVAIKVYITSNVGMGVGDKAVFGNQMKTVVGHILTGVNETESGVQLDAIFGAKSIMDRIVLSPLIIGTTNTLLRVIGEKAAAMYFAGEPRT